jgi:hypothetical protein
VKCLSSSVAMFRGLARAENLAMISSSSPESSADDSRGDSKVLVNGVDEGDPSAVSFPLVRLTVFVRRYRQ